MSYPFSLCSGRVIRPLLFAIALTPLPVFGQASWNGSTGGAWNVDTNWTPIGVPDAVGAEVTTTLTSVQTINLNGGTYRVGKLNINGTGGNAASMSVFSNGTLHLVTNSPGSVPVIELGKWGSLETSLTGNQGFELKGAGALYLKGDNSGLAGDITLSGGRLWVEPNGRNGSKYILNGGVLTYSTTNPLQVLSNDIEVRENAPGSSGSLLLSLTGRVDMTVSSAISVASGKTFSVYGTPGNNSKILFNGSLTGGANTGFSVANGTATITVALDADDFGGRVSIAGGNDVLVAKDNALGKGSTVTLSGGRVLSSDSNVERTLDSTLQYATTSPTMSVGSSTEAYEERRGKITFLGGLDLVNNADRTLYVRNSALEIEGAMVRSQNGGSVQNFTKMGAGTLILSAMSGNNTRNHILVNGGHLLINGVLSQSASATTVTVNGDADPEVLSGTLGGVGRIERAVTVNLGGTLSPGDNTAVSTLGTLTLAHSLTMEAGSTLKLELGNTTQYDRLVLVDSALTLVDNAVRLSLSLGGGFTSTSGDVFTIVNGFSSLGGTFLGLADGAMIGVGDYDFRINYNNVGKSIVLTNMTAAIPEPSTYALLALTGLGMALYRRRQLARQG